MVFVPLMLILIYFGRWPFNLAITAVLLLAAFEFSRVFNKIGYHPSPALIMVSVLILIIQRWFFKDQYLDIAISTLLFISICVALYRYERGEKESAADLAINLAGIFVIGWVGSFFISLRALSDGLGWTLTALPCVWLADAGAYSIGRRWGARKLAPQISPGKTWEGLIAGIVSGTLSGLLLVLLWRAIGPLPETTPLWQGAVMGLVLSILSPVGDLVISLFKRTAGVKDTSNLIPGHGGVLDRIDTWIWGALLGYYLVLIFQAL